MMKYVLKSHEYTIWNGNRYLGKFRAIGQIWMYVSPSIIQPLYADELAELARDLITLNKVGEI